MFVQAHPGATEPQGIPVQVFGDSQLMIRFLTHESSSSHSTNPYIGHLKDARAEEQVLG